MEAGSSGDKAAYFFNFDSFDVGNHSTHVSLNEVLAIFPNEHGEVGSSRGSSRPTQNNSNLRHGNTNPAEINATNFSFSRQNYVQPLHDEYPPFTAGNDNTLNLSRNENAITGLSNNPTVTDDPHWPQLSLCPASHCPPPPPPLPPLSSPFNPPIESNSPTVRVVQPFPQEQSVYSLDHPHHQFNAQPQCGFQLELFQPRPMTPINQNSTFCGDQNGQFSPNNNMISNNFQQAPDYCPPFPHTQMRMNQQEPQPDWLSLNNNVVYRPFTPTGSQTLPNQFHHHNQVHGMPNMYDPQYHNFMQTGPSCPHRPQQISYQMNQLPNLTPSNNVCDPQGCNRIQPDPALSLRPLQFPPPQDQHQNHQVSQYNNPMPFMLPWNQQYNQAVAPFTLEDPSQFGLSSLSTHPSRQVNQNGGKSTSSTYNNMETCCQPFHLLGSESQNQEARGNNNTFSLQLDAQPPSSKGKEILGRRTIFEVGESSSSSSKRPRVEITAQEKDGNSEVIDLSRLRFSPAKNSVYDPLYEGIGLPIDPHLRMFCLL